MKNSLYFLIFLSGFYMLWNNSIQNEPKRSEPIVIKQEPPQIAVKPKLLRVAVIDTGFDARYKKYVNLCSSGHKDFTGEGFRDDHGHGTNVVGLIVNNARSHNYCIILIKAYSMNPQTQETKKEYLTKALKYAYDIKPDIINLSSGGLHEIYEEKKIIKKILDSHITLITAAGNESMNLDDGCIYYPACYDSRIFVVGNEGKMSNYGHIVDITYPADNQTAFGRTFSGTSQATAIFTGKLLKNIELKQSR